MERLRQWRIAERVADAIIVLDANRMIRFANGGAARLADLKDASELVGQSYAEIIKRHRVLNEDGSAADPHQFPSELALREGKETRNCIYSEINAKGTHHWLSISAFPLPEDSSGIKLVGVIFEDISRRKLREDKLRFLIESSKILSITTDLHTRLREKTRLLIPRLADWATINLLNEGGTLTRLTVEHRDRSKMPQVERFAEIAAETPDAAVYRVARQGRTELHASISAENIGAPVQSEEQRKLARELRPCSALIVPIRSTTGKTLGVLSLAYTNDSGRHYTEEDVEFMDEFAHHLSVIIENTRLYQEVAKRDTAKDTFLATLSHELRNPLAPIKSSLEMIHMKNVDPMLSHELSVIDHQFDHMEKLLRDLLDVTRFALGKIRMHRATIDLSTLVRTTVATFRPGAERKGVQLSLSAPEESTWISGDAVRIEQLVTNLLNNADKFTPEGGRIDVTVRTVGNNAIISVADTGIGIAAEDLSKIFDQYFQARTLPEGTGLGMGLVLVREIVRLHGGSVYVESAGKGCGATFTFSLPMDRWPDNTERKSHGSEYTRITVDRRTILVIDDNREAADSLVKLLSAVGYDASARYSGREGIGSFPSIKPDHVIIDIGMPEMNGYDVAKELRDRHGEAVHLIALSGYGMAEDKRKAEKAGFNHHLIKPVGLKELRYTLENVS